MFTSSRIFFLSLLCCLGTFIHAQEVQQPVEQKKLPSMLTYSAVHGVANIFATVQIPLFLIAGALCSTCLKKNEIDTNIPIFASLAASLYVFYKSPEWTDKYFLGMDRERTTLQNIFSFAARYSIFQLGWPSVVGGVLELHPDDITRLQGKQVCAEQTDAAAQPA